MWANSITSVAHRLFCFTFACCSPGKYLQCIATLLNRYLKKTFYFDVHDKACKLTEYESTSSRFTLLLSLEKIVTHERKQRSDKWFHSPYTRLKGNVQQLRQHYPWMGTLSIYDEKMMRWVGGGEKNGIIKISTKIGHIVWLIFHKFHLLSNSHMYLDGLVHIDSLTYKKMILMVP